MATIQQEIRLVGAPEVVAQLQSLGAAGESAGNRLKASLGGDGGGFQGSALAVNRLSHEFLQLGTSLASGRLNLQEIGLIALNVGRHVGDAGLAGGIAKLGGMFGAALTNPVTIAIAGLGALGYAFQAVSTESSRTTQSLADQKKVLDDLHAGYGKTGAAAIERATVPVEAKSLDIFSAQTTVGKSQSDLINEIGQLRARTRGALAGLSSDVSAEVRAATERLAKIPTPNYQDVIRYLSQLGTIGQAIPFEDTRQRSWLQTFIRDVETGAKETAKTLAQQSTAGQVFAQGLDPAVRVYREMSNAADNASDSVADANRKISSSIRAVADAADTAAMAYGKMVVTTQYAAREQALQRQQIEEFAPAGAHISEEEARLRLREFALKNYGGRGLETVENPIPNMPRGMESAADIERALLYLQGQNLLQRYRESQATEEATGMKAGASRLYGALNLSPTGGLGPAAEIAKAQRGYATASDAIEAASQNVDRSFRGAAEAADALKDALNALASYNQANKNAAMASRFAADFGEAGGGYITGPGTGTSDSILARVSTGEYVINARSVARVGTSFLDAVNGYAGGGIVLSPAIDMAGMSGMSHQIDLRTDGGEFRVYASDSTVEAIRNSAIADLMYSTGIRPTWYS